LDASDFQNSQNQGETVELGLLAAHDLSATAFLLDNAPFFGHHLEDFGGLVPDDVPGFRHGADQPPKDGTTTQAQISAAIVDSDLNVATHEVFFRVEVPDFEFAVFVARDDTKCLFFHITPVVVPVGASQPFGSAASQPFRLLPDAACLIAE